jgi:hypothetical protein
MRRRASHPYRRYAGEQALIVERRTANGALDLTGEQPPTWMLDTTEHELSDYFYKHNPGPDTDTRSREEIAAWYAAKGWRWRPRAW